MPGSLLGAESQSSKGFDCMSGLVSRLADDEDSAWAELYDTTIDAMFAYVTVLVVVERLLPMSCRRRFLRLHRSRDRLRDVDDLQAFVFTVVRNETNRSIARNRKHLSAGEVTEPLIDEDADSDDDIEMIQQALAMLSTDERELIHMKIYAQMTFTQISTLLGLPMGTCTSRYRRSLEKMRVFLQSKCNERIRNDRAGSFTDGKGKAAILPPFERAQSDSISARDLCE